MLGAVGGAAVALLLYQGYKIGVPVVTAWLVVPQSQIAADHPGTVRIDGIVSEYEYNRFAAKAKEIYERFSAEQGPKAELSRTGIEVTQPVSASVSPLARVNPVDLAAQSSAASSSLSAASSVSSISSSSVMTADAVVADAASSARSRAETQLQAKLAGTKLPNSGMGAMVAAAMALGAATWLRRKRASR